ncbi:hypothetical protein GMPD_22650 [Geomonas paludis]|uniref:Uncharacterized protein n=1 Tax=Geomonas paludis TaxID=2740185 RepID=A0A6V8MVZ0_9BACT|nr:hypothetical protein GMPD_22650 [Geomonas paludis]
MLPPGTMSPHCKALTPAPLPEGEGWTPEHITEQLNSSAGFTGLPLPMGEGWGEGDATDDPFETSGKAA